MQIFQFSREGQPPQRREAVERLPDDGFIWLDFRRDEAREWSAWAQRLSGVTVHEDHVSDSFNGDHRSFFDGTGDYDMLIFQGLTPEACESATDLIVTRSAAFFFFDRLLITVHGEENLSFDIVKRKFCEAKLRFPSTPFGLAHAVLDVMVERYLTIVDELEKRLEDLQDALLDPRNPFQDWRQLLHYRKQAHEMELLCERNLHAVDSWRRQVGAELSENQRVRLNDLREHIERVQTHGDSIQKDVEVAVQLYFASMSHRTNRVVQALTVLSAIFFPLTLITGIYGMNFEHMPELAWRYGYFGVLALLVGLGGGLLLYFKRRGFF